jgi:hypothetical protein
MMWYGQITMAEGLFLLARGEARFLRRHPGLRMRIRIER